MSARIVSIDLGDRSYDIYIGSGLLTRFNDFVPEDVTGRHVFVVCDENTSTYGESVRGTMKQSGASSVSLNILKPGEKTKCFSQFESLCEWMIQNGVNRNSIVIAVGGGVIGDLAGFAAASVMRGVHYVQVPTSLLAQVDSSVGGKTGINSSQGKNLIGAFYQPISVVADIDVLKTLPKRELLAGYAEVLKYGLIADLPFFEWLEENGEKVCNLDTDAVSYAIETSTKAKAAVVQSDEKEEGRRALLNLGHTFGHALEAAAGYDGRLLHGEAVSIGMVMAFDLSHRMQLCSQEHLERVQMHLAAIGLPTKASEINGGLRASVDGLIAIMQKDKKVVSGKMTFIVANGIGEAFITQDVPEKLVRAVLSDSLGSKAVDAKEPKVMFNKGIKGLWKSAFSSLSS